MSRNSRAVRRSDWFATGFIAITLFGLIAAMPIGPAVPDEGRIIAIHRGRWRPDVSAEFVSAGTGFTARTPLPRRHDCRAGDTIRLKRFKRVLGTGYSRVGQHPCTTPFSPPTQLPISVPNGAPQAARL